ncbi:MAG: hypothetical protein PVG71_10550 [Anaerolineae bacterium]|jgi:hypothetical protein
MNQQTRYLAYLLRLWQEGGGCPEGDPLGAPLDEPPMWRASLEIPQSGERLGFASLADLFTFLENETRPSSPGSEHLEEEGRWRVQPTASREVMGWRRPTARKRRER